MEGGLAVASLDPILQQHQISKPSKDVFTSERETRASTNVRSRTSRASKSESPENSINKANETEKPQIPHASLSRLASSGTDTWSWAQYFEKIELRFTSSLLLSLFILYSLPFYSSYAAQIIEIQYIDPKTGLAGIGIKDAYFVLLSLCIVVMVRAIFVKYVLIYIAKNWAGIQKKKPCIRFAEQGWDLIYFACSCFIGLRLLSQSPYSKSTKALWEDWPHNQMTPLFKAYYLFQFGYWIAQVYVIHVEEKRKDHYQMLTHHIITCFLMQGSYYYYYTRVGHVILLVMDFVDAQLSFAKLLKYCGYQTLCDYAFVAFLVGWISLRHVVYCYVTWSASTEAFEVIKHQCYYDETTGDLIRCFSPKVHWILVALLCLLQILTFLWLTMIIKVVMVIVRGGGAEDNRSDEEDDEEDEK